MLCAVAVALGCAGEEPESTRARGTLTVYAAAPTHGISGAAGRATLAGARRALADARGKAGRRSVRLVSLSSTRPGDDYWDPGTVEANAKRATDDEAAIAYVGEADLGGSAISLPVTNRAGLLQVSPADGLTSLTRPPPGRPRAGPERYYPGGARTFTRLVPSDLMVADAMLAQASRRGLRRVALLYTEGIAERELAGVIAFRLRRAGRPAVLAEPVRDDLGATAALVRELRTRAPQAILLAGVRGRAADGLFAELGRELSRTPVIASGSLATAGVALPATALTGVLPVAEQPAAGRAMARALARDGGDPVHPESLYGYDAMRMVLSAVARGGPDRRAVVRAALAPRGRLGVTGTYTVLKTGDVAGRPIALIDLRDGSGR